MVKNPFLDVAAQNKVPNGQNSTKQAGEGQVAG
jgi:hypothetical protein